MGFRPGRDEGEHIQIEKMLLAKKYSWGSIGNAITSNAIEVLFSLPGGIGQEPRKRDGEQMMNALNARLKKRSHCSVGNTRNFNEAALVTKRRVICSEEA